MPLTGVVAPHHTQGQGRRQNLPQGGRVTRVEGATQPQGRDTRILLPDPPSGVEPLLEILVTPVLGTGSSVVTVGCTPDQLISVATAEHAILVS